MNHISMGFGIGQNCVEFSERHSMTLICRNNHRFFVSVSGAFAS